MSDVELEQLKNYSAETDARFHELNEQMTELRAENKKLFDRVVTAEGSLETAKKNEEYDEWKNKKLEEQIAELRAENEDLKRFSPSGTMALRIGALKDELNQLRTANTELWCAMKAFEGAYEFSKSGAGISVWLEPSIEQMKVALSKHGGGE